MTAPQAEGFGFRVLAKAESGHARAALFSTPHAEVETPTFMPVGTQGSVKGLTAAEVARVDGLFDRNFNLQPVAAGVAS